MSKVRVFDLLGREIYRTETVKTRFDLSTGAPIAIGAKVEIDLSGYSAGIYHLRVVTNRYTGNTKVVIR